MDSLPHLCELPDDSDRAAALAEIERQDRLAELRRGRQDMPAQLRDAAGTIICLECGQPIHPRRAENPAHVLCIDCQRENERIEQNVRRCYAD